MRNDFLTTATRRHGEMQSQKHYHGEHGEHGERRTSIRKNRFLVFSGIEVFSVPSVVKKSFSHYLHFAVPPCRRGVRAVREPPLHP
jgi:hypothetical protein